jgi:diguanylate cyclase (GGDEF)-like protein
MRAASALALESEAADETEGAPGAIELDDRDSHLEIALELSDGTPVGFLCLVGPPASRYEEADLELLTAMGRMLASHIERERREAVLVRLADELYREATTDELTGLTNRRSFTASLERELRLSARGTVRSYLVIADVDNLKAVNDRYGHAMGDLCLKDVGRALTESARETDVVARIGGDEFGVLLIGADDQEDVVRFCDRLRERLDAVARERRRRIRVSVGTSELAPASSSTEALDLADRDMYRSKRGRGHPGDDEESVP